MRCLLDFMMVLTRRQASKDFELLVLRHENAVLRRQVLHDAGIGPAPRRTGPTGNSS